MCQGTGGTYSYQKGLYPIQASPKMPTACDLWRSVCKGHIASSLPLLHGVFTPHHCSKPCLPATEENILPHTARPGHKGHHTAAEVLGSWSVLGVTTLRCMMGKTITMGLFLKPHTNTYLAHWCIARPQKHKQIKT